jgi:hypothetical protein
MPGRRNPLHKIRAHNPFAPLTPEDWDRFAGKWVVAYAGKVRGVGKSLEEALRRAKMPEGAEPDFAIEIPAREILRDTWFL